MLSRGGRGEDKAREGVLRDVARLHRGDSVQSRARRDLLCRSDRVHRFHQRPAERLGEHEYAEDGEHREQEPHVHEGKGTEHEDDARCGGKRGKTVLFKPEGGAEIEHRRHDERPHRGRDEIAHRDIKEGERDHDEEGYLLVHFEFAEQPIDRRRQRGDVQPADGEDVRKPARLYVAVEKVVYAALVPYHQGAGDDGCLGVHILVKEFADRKLNGEDEIGLPVCQQFRLLAVQSEIGAVEHVCGEVGVESLVPDGDQLAREHDDVTRAEIRHFERHVHSTLPFQHSVAHTQVLHRELRHAVLHEYLACDTRREPPFAVLDEAGIHDIGGTGTGEEAYDERDGEIKQPAQPGAQCEKHAYREREQERDEPEKVMDGIKRFGEDDAESQQKSKETDGPAIEDPSAPHVHFASWGTPRPVTTMSAPSPRMSCSAT